MVDGSGPKMTIFAGISADDPEFAFIQLDMDGVPRGHIRLVAAELEAFIHQLAHVRSQMADQVPGELDPGATLQAIVSPAYRVPPTHSGPADHVLLTLRHPGLGWLGFAFGPNAAVHIGRALIDPGASQPPE